MSEEWRPVVGYEGLYEVSDQGRVRSLDRVVQRRGGLAAGRPMRIRGRVLAQSAMSNRDHLKVGLSRDDESRTVAVHALVLTAFVGPRSEGMEGCHYDGDPTNNRLDNLRWDDRSGNVQDSIRHGTFAPLQRIACPRGHRLAVPNLRSNQLAKGHRQCLACHRASAAGRKAVLKGRPFDMQLVSDQRYAEIIAAVA